MRRITIQNTRKNSFTKSKRYPATVVQTKNNTPKHNQYLDNDDNKGFFTRTRKVSVNRRVKKYTSAIELADSDHIRNVSNPQRKRSRSRIKIRTSGELYEIRRNKKV